MSFLRSYQGSTGKVGCVGFCLGGSLAYTMACSSDSDASIGYYPVQIDDHLPYAEYIKKPAMFHIAEKDDFCPPESQTAIAQAFEKNGKITLQTGYGPSGLPHIGTFGEVARTTMMVNAIKQITEIPSEIIKPTSALALLL